MHITLPGRGREGGRERERERERETLSIQGAVAAPTRRLLELGHYGLLCATGFVPAENGGATKNIRIAPAARPKLPLRVTNPTLSS